MEITGNITAALPVRSGTSQRSGNTWKKQDYVLEIPGAWPRHMAFTVFGEDRLNMLAIKQGEQNVTIQFDIDAHEYQGRWFNEIRAYNIIRHNAQQQSPTPPPAASASAQQAQGQQAQQPQPSAQGENTDDLPF